MHMYILIYVYVVPSTTICFDPDDGFNKYLSIYDDIIAKRSSNPGKRNSTIYKYTYLYQLVYITM